MAETNSYSDLFLHMFQYTLFNYVGPICHSPFFYCLFFLSSSAGLANKFGILGNCVELVAKSSAKLRILSHPFRDKADVYGVSTLIVPALRVQIHQDL